MARVSEAEVNKIILSDWCHGTFKDLAKDLANTRLVLHDLLERLEGANNGPDVPIRLEFGQSHIKEIKQVLG